MTEPVYAYRAVLDRVIDGDTYVFDVDLGFRVTALITVRLRGLFTAESSQPGGAEATLRAQQAFQDAKQIVLMTYKDRMSFTRWMRCAVASRSLLVWQSTITVICTIPSAARYTVPSGYTVRSVHTALYARQWVRGRIRHLPMFMWWLAA